MRVFFRNDLTSPPPSWWVLWPTGSPGRPPRRAGAPSRRGSTCHSSHGLRPHAWRRVGQGVPLQVPATKSLAMEVERWNRPPHATQTGMLGSEPAMLTRYSCVAEPEGITEEGMSATHDTHSRGGPLGGENGGGQCLWSAICHNLDRCRLKSSSTLLSTSAGLGRAAEEGMR